MRLDAFLMLWTESLMRCLLITQLRGARGALARNGGDCRRLGAFGMQIGVLEHRSASRAGGWVRSSDSGEANRGRRPQRGVLLPAVTGTGRRLLGPEA